jgi:uncharacterized protein YbjQ (UPF0145 family)
MLAVTIESVPGYDVRAVVGEVVGVTVRPQNLYLEGVKALNGDRNPQYRQHLSAWREDAIAHMLEQAHERGANAVVGLRFDHRVIDGSWAEICAYGTAVVVERKGRSSWGQRARRSDGRGTGGS